MFLSVFGHLIVFSCVFNVKVNQVRFGNPYPRMSGRDRISHYDFSSFRVHLRQNRKFDTYYESRYRLSLP